jgi:hypothetical protein
MKSILSVIIVLLLIGCNKDTPMPKQEEKVEKTAEIGLRRMALASSAHSLHFSPDNEFPKVYGIIIDWEIGRAMASILSMKDGSASLYTTTSFGIIGGSVHEKVRIAAENLVKIANTFFDSGKETTEYPYPKSDQVFFYLLTYDGVRQIPGV